MCAHNCTNTRGSFRCTCLPGYSLQEDQRTCQGNSNVVLNINYYGYSSYVHTYLFTFTNILCLTQCVIILHYIYYYCPNALNHSCQPLEKIRDTLLESCLVILKQNIDISVIHKEITIYKHKY